MRNAAAVSSSAMVTAMRATQPGMNERQLDALLEYEVRRRGATSLAYPPVVAGGARANTLHYVRNDQLLRAGDLLLVDAGAEYAGYCADITRVWPVDGRFSEPQAAVYNAVLAVQETCLAALQAGAVDSFRALEETARAVLGTELEKLGLVRPSMPSAARRETLYRLMPHAIGHYIGMDVHDCSTVSTMAPRLVAGVALTVEPGIYIPDLDGFPAELRGLGVRIEDDVVICAGGGVEVLTASCPKVRPGASAAFCFPPATLPSLRVSCACGHVALPMAAPLFHRVLLRSRLPATHDRQCRRRGLAARRCKQRKRPRRSGPLNVKSVSLL